MQPDDLLLRMGEYDLGTDEEAYPYVERKVQIVASHPNFDARTFEYDLALLRFYDPVHFQPNIIPICLPQGNPTFVGESAFVTGWGRLYEGIFATVIKYFLKSVIYACLLHRWSTTFQNAAGGSSSDK